MEKIGTAIYTITTEGLEAQWYSRVSNLISTGIGKAKLKTPKSHSKPFHGDYEITYFDKEGNNLGTYALNIHYKSENGCYLMEWKQGTTMTHFGIGIEFGGRLHFGYQKITLNE